MAEGDNKTLKIVGITCGVIALLGVCTLGACLVCTGGGIGAIFVAAAAPAEQTNGFLADVRAQRLGGAYRRMSADYRATHTLATFEQNVRGMPVLIGHSAAQVAGRTISTANGVGTAHVAGTLTTPQGPVPFEATLTQHHDKWEIDSIDVAGTRLP